MLVLEVSVPTAQERQHQELEQGESEPAEVAEGAELEQPDGQGQYRAVEEVLAVAEQVGPAELDFVLELLLALELGAVVLEGQTQLLLLVHLERLLDARR